MELSSRETRTVIHGLVFGFACVVGIVVAIIAGRRLARKVGVGRPTA